MQEGGYGLGDIRRQGFRGRPYSLPTAQARCARTASPAQRQGDGKDLANSSVSFLGLGSFGLSGIFAQERFHVS